MRPDPNKDRNDTMVPDYWTLGEDFQDAVRAAGYDHPQVDGIAVDIHDLLQAADVIRTALQEGTLDQKIETLSFEFDHIRWHCDQALTYLGQAKTAVSQSVDSQ